MVVESVEPESHAELIGVWESSVRATHDFISEEIIEFYKPIIIKQAFPALNLKCVRNKNNRIIGFIGVSDTKIEMLFLLNEARGQGIGRLLLEYAIKNMQINSVDVNEQNLKAVGFYKHMGFNVISRSPVDSMGKPFPILHMEL